MAFIMMVVTATLSLVIIGMVFTLMIGLFDARVDNGEIFKIITPAFSTVIGAFVGLLGGLSINGPKKEEKKSESTGCPNCGK